MKKFVHIGFPKNLSTTLQRDYFPKHPDIYYLGVGIGSNIGYLDDDINVALEEALLYMKNRNYNKVKNHIKEAFNKHFKIAKEKGYKAVGISAELLCFSFSPDHIDSEEKAKRIHEIFGDDTTIVAIIRNQKDLLDSMYREYVKIGYDLTFREFIEYCFYFSDRNFISDFFYSETYHLYSEYFGDKNVNFIQIEDYRDGELFRNDSNEILLTKKLNQILKIKDINLQLGHYNNGLNKTELETMRRMNSLNRNNFSKNVTHTVNGHRLATYFNKTLETPLPQTLVNDVKVKQENLIKSKDVNKQKYGEIDLYKDKYLYNKLFTLFKEDNLKLKQLISPLHKNYNFY